MSDGSAPDQVSAAGWHRVAKLRFVEDVFFLLTTLSSFYFAVVVVRSAGDGPVRLAGFFAFWVVVAYLGLPRLNRMLSTIYVPDYIIGRTQAGDGVLGDPVNTAVRGTSYELAAAMAAAGWTQADPITLRSSIRITLSALLKRSYPSAPVSSLYLFGHRQNVAYEQQVHGNASQRHHVRFFATPDGWLLPGGHRVDWLGAASYDRSVGLSLFTLQITHKIDADIDVERDHVLSTVASAHPGLRVETIPAFSTGYHARNGGGDRFRTDGNLPILELGDAGVVRAPGPGPDRPADVEGRPTSIVVAVTTALLSVLVTSGRLVSEIAGLGPMTTVAFPGLGGGITLPRPAAIVAVVALACAVVALAWRTYLGRVWSRVALLCVVAVSMGSQFTLGHAAPLALLDMGLALATMYALTTPSARDFTGEPDDLPALVSGAQPPPGASA